MRALDLAEGHLREAQGMTISSIGLGTRLGPAVEATDERYRETLLQAAAMGCNLFDAAPEYRDGRSERLLGELVQVLEKQDRLVADPVLCSKGGSFAKDDRRIPEQAPEDTVVEDDEGLHCLWPEVLEAQLARSLDRIRRDPIDIYYLEGLEAHARARGSRALLIRLPAAFEILERARQRGQIRCFGIASSSGLLAEPPEHGYLDLAGLVRLARDVGGEDHGLRFVQAPYSLKRPTAAAARNQSTAGSSHSLVQAAGALGLSFIAAESLASGGALDEEPTWLSGALPGEATRPQAALQFVRSTPGVAAALVSTMRREHAAEDLALARMPFIPRERFEEILPPEAPQVPWLFGKTEQPTATRGKQ